MLDWRSNCNTYLKHLAKQQKGFKTITTHYDGKGLVEHLKEEWEDIQQCYDQVGSAFPDDPSPEEEEVCNEHNAAFAAVAKEYREALAKMRLRIRALKKRAEAPASGPQQAANLKTKKGKQVCWGPTSVSP